MIECNSIPNWAALKRIFNSVDKVGSHTVFNIGGNKYRVIAIVRFEAQVLYVRGVLTHAEYDKGNWMI